VPPLLLSVFGTTNVVYQRYALFSLLFYFLLISNGLVSLVEVASKAGAHGSGDLIRRVLTSVALAITCLVFVPFVIGVVNYYLPMGHPVLSFRPPDNRSAVRYLSAQVKPVDLMIFVVSPPGITIADFRGAANGPA